MDAEILDRLLQLNPWLGAPARYRAEITRHLPPDMIARRTRLPNFEDPRRAKLLIGPRQVGKSTLLWSRLLDQAPQSVLVLNAEESAVQRWLRSAAAVIHDLETELPTIRTLFIEEAQHLDEAGLVIKGIIDARRDLDVLVTGSSAYHLEARTRESLAGRAIRRVILPFSVAELLEHDPSPLPAVQGRRAREIVERQLVHGAYPGVWFHERPADELGELVEAFVIRDASDRFEIQRPDAFRRLLQLCAGQVGSMVNLAEWASILGISAGTVRQYLGVLEDSWIVHQLPAFAGGKRSEITSASRLHLYDMGLRNALLGNFSADLRRRADLGALLEGWVFGELCKSKDRAWTLHYWRTKGGAEMDFVLACGTRVIGVEVRAGAHGRISRSTRSFIEAYAPELVLVVGLDEEEHADRLDQTELRWLPPQALGALIEARTAVKADAA